VLVNRGPSLVNLQRRHPTMNYSHLTISDAHAETMRILTED